MSNNEQITTLNLQQEINDIFKIETAAVTKNGLGFVINLNKNKINRTYKLDKNGNIREYNITSTLKGANGKRDYSGEYYAYKNNIIKITFENTIHPIENAIESWNVSIENNRSTAYLVENSERPTYYTLYIQTDGIIQLPENTNYLFYNFSNLEKLDGLENVDTSNVKMMEYMFSGCSELVSLDLSNFDTQNVESMAGMFYLCKKLGTINTSSFDTSKVWTMYCMFYVCNNLENLLINNFDTTKVTNMGSMFLACGKVITEFTVRNSSTVNCQSMFVHSACTSNSKIVVNYIEGNSTLVDTMINTKTENSNVIKGILIK